MYKIYVLKTAKHQRKREIKEDLNKWRDIPCAWFRRLGIVKMSIAPKLIYRFDAVSIKILVGAFVEIEKLILSL